MNQIEFGVCLNINGPSKWIGISVAKVHNWPHGCHQVLVATRSASKKAKTAEYSSLTGSEFSKGIRFPKWPKHSET